MVAVEEGIKAPVAIDVENGRPDSVFDIVADENVFCCSDGGGGGAEYISISPLIFALAVYVSGLHGSMTIFLPPMAKAPLIPIAVSAASLVA